MKKKLIITESQLNRLSIRLTENSVYSSVVKKMKEELDSNYEPIQKFVHKGGEYFEKPMITVKADNETISPKSLFQYMKYKYKVSDDFIKQVIQDWANGSIGDDYLLTKNVTMD